MTTTEMYQAAVDALGSGFGVSRQTLSGGAELICQVKRVAGRSVVAKHYRTNWFILPLGDKYSKTISRKQAAEYLL